MERKEDERGHLSLVTLEGSKQGATRGKLREGKGKRRRGLSRVGMVTCTTMTFPSPVVDLFEGEMKRE
jgi:hypothetical protein